eukprot:CAMPEP_0176497872 /NCGR_PEP_ID=MMETSP0200_2-20121128/11984_1 /TAXON_ID=947934 /ORGANISM="Chaetoceros sp., Strain GSL56" /LENGTH=265 /DNA_ID=CAMNT_0017895971 /DNA_START=136 /DNA_END=933 /DNA_ORIENTATION=+
MTEFSSTRLQSSCSRPGGYNANNEIYNRLTELTKPQTSSYTRHDDTILYNTRRSFLDDVVSTSTVALLFQTMALAPSTALAAQQQEGEEGTTKTAVVKTVQTPLYYILRVREATEQETRLIKSGKFKDVQRANVKLAVKFMVDNYRLNDNFIAASAFLTGDRRIKAGDIGQTVVQNLYTILEYFDASDVENIKVGSTGLAGKEVIVLNGLQAAKKGIDDFVSLFPKEDVMAVIARIEEENSLNEKEFDKELNQGSGILNPKPTIQ